MAEQKEYFRFTVPQRFEHWILVISFTGLVLTGIPQKFAGADWAEWMIGVLGGIESVRIIHHASAIVLVLASVYHVIAVAYKIFVLRVRWTMFPRFDDVLDALDAIRFNLGLTKEHLKFDRYNFGEKVEYWALVWGTVIMGLTGFIMWNPINAARFLPGDIIPAAKAAHGAEAILAALAIVIWHFYNVHVKTFSKAMFTGKMTQHQMEEEHALELARIEQAKIDPRPAAEIIKKRERIFIPVAAVASVIALLALFFLITYENTAPLTTLPRRAQQVQVFSPITPTPLPSAGVTPAGAVVAKPLPADHAGRTTCLACHTNLPQPALPADHAGRTGATCTACHKAGGAPPAPPTTGPATYSPRATRAPPPCAPPAAGGPKCGPAATRPGPLPQPADHTGRTTCLACHASLPQPALPADHAGRTDATCAACHKAP